MKRCIYIGKPWGDIQYGRTGVVVDILWSEAENKFCFIPDGDSTRYWTVRRLFYIPSEDQRRHCPKPV